jgi:hypothetical protein
MEVAHSRAELKRWYICVKTLIRRFKFSKTLLYYLARLAFIIKIKGCFHIILANYDFVGVFFIYTMGSCVIKAFDIHGFPVII